MSGVPAARSPRLAPAARPGGDPPRIGLVLAGGGARGAYQVGVVHRLADLGVPVAALAGCSIGALNGAIVAAAPDLRTAASRLAAVWHHVSAVAGPSPRRVDLGQPGITALPVALADLAARAASPVLLPGFLESLVRERIDASEVRRGVPLWVSVFPSLAQDPTLAQWSWILDVVRGWTGARAEWLHVNELPEAEVHQAVLASAALPVILPSRTVAGRTYVDGGLGDVTAAGALLKNGACDVMIVTHLDRGLLWDAHQFPGMQVIEIRPRESLRGEGLLGGLTATLDFSPERVNALIRQGYDDAAYTLDRVARILDGVDARRRGTDVMLGTIARLPPLPGSPGAG